MPRVHYIEYVHSGVSMAPCGRGKVEGVTSTLSMTRKREKVDCKLCLKLMEKKS